MYLFSFKKFAGQDRVFHSTFSSGKPGDLLETQDDILLNLGEEISFSELYTHSYPTAPMKVLYPAFFDQHFLFFLHRMVYEWYSTYKQVIKYFVSMEIEELLIREHKLPTKKKAEPRGTTSEQTLLIFPDNWTRANMIEDAFLNSQGHKALQLFSMDTQNRKDINRRTIKKGSATTIIATHSEVFQPFSHLKKILVIDPKKWYYHNQQDPRYALPTVVQKMANIYGAEIKEINYQGKLAFEK